MNPKHQNIFLAGFFALILAFMLPAQSFSQQADTPCDPDYFDSLKSRAWLEAQREITQNQNLIFKPDSVFEYTCFDLFLNEIADHAKDMFSETNRWGAIPGVSETSMDDALQDLVGDALNQYIDQNFEIGEDGSYDLLGGRLNDEGIDHDFKPINGANAVYACDIMNQVWMAAKCMNFIDDEDHDGFFTFEDYANNDDHRFLPSQCRPDIKSRWDQERRTATVDDDTPWTEDKVETFFDKLDPKNCNNAEALPTGVTVQRVQRPTGYPEHVCIMPGCYYNPSSKKCSTSPG